MSDITLSAGVRQNLLSLQKTADLMATTQNRLATGKKVNTALDNATNFFTASSLQARSNELSALMDGMSNGVKTLEAADNGLTSITKTLESMQSTLRQARQDKTFQTSTYTLGLGATPAGTEMLSFSGGSVGTTAVDVDLTTNTAAAATTASTATGLTGGTTLAAAGFANGETLIIGDGTDTVTYTVGTAATEDLDDLISAINLDANVDVTASIDPTTGAFTLTADDNTQAITVGGTGAIAGLAAQGVPAAVNEALTVDQIVASINSDVDLKGKVRATNDSGSLRIENQSTQELTVTGVTTTGTIDGDTGTSAIGGNTIRAELATQFNELRDQLDKLSDDASYNGVNLLRGDLLRLTFNETDTSTIDIQTKNAEALNSAYLNLGDIVAQDLDSDNDIDALISTVKAGLNTVRSQSSAFGSNLSIVENRRDFTKAMMNTLQTGADNLVLADGNEEAANMLALQTRQQLSSTALSLASQADQAPLQLF
ncbi:flagellin [Breoghania sp. L-A4]|uniref:flagellin N-terminal helical domain-containing protein n=1 Tax=Breoghania sp. L-A4 TaxID=2304600 RepID=UPI000E3594E2|nr:flagellin [Breoghania sp. L-A4]AXS41221.1 hypothetical protein D1F64_15810 [Breoghania sp. L-A4]